MDFAEAAVRTGPHTSPTGTRGRVWTLGQCLKVHFSASSQHCSAGPLNGCKVSSHTHLTLLSHWVQTAFVTSTQHGFPLASVYTQAPGGWLPALLISSFAPAAFLKATDLFPSFARDKLTVNFQSLHLRFSNKAKRAWEADRRTRRSRGRRSAALWNEELEMSQQSGNKKDRKLWSGIQTAQIGDWSSKTRPHGSAVQSCDIFK